MKNAKMSLFLFCYENILSVSVFFVSKFWAVPDSGKMSTHCLTLDLI